jgi:hypothetical protein
VVSQFKKSRAPRHDARRDNVDMESKRLRDPNQLAKLIVDNGSSKKFDNHVAMVALHFMHYNFARLHRTLRITPV